MRTSLVSGRHKWVHETSDNLCLKHSTYILMSLPLEEVVLQVLKTLPYRVSSAGRLDLALPAGLLKYQNP